MSQGLTKEEVNRKLLHGLAVVLPAGIFYGPDLLGLTHLWVCTVMFALLGFSLLIEIVRFRNQAFLNWFMRWFGSMMRKSELRQLSGASYVLAGSAICSVISLYGDFMAASCFLCLTLFILGVKSKILVFILFSSGKKATVKFG